MAEIVPPTFAEGPFQDVRGTRGSPVPGQPTIPVPYQVAGGAPAEIADAFRAILLDDRAVKQEIKDSLRDVSLHLGKMTSFFDPQSNRRSLLAMERGDLVSALQEAFLTTAAAVVGPMAGGGGGGGAGPGAGPATPGRPATVGGSSGPYDESPASTGDAPRRDSGGAPDRPPPRTGLTAYQETRGMFGGPQGGQRMFDPLGLRGGAEQAGFDAGGIRTRVGGAIQRWASERQFGPNLVASETSQTGYRWASHTGRGGQIASRDDAERFEKGQVISNAINRVAGPLAEGQGLGRAVMNALPARAGMVLGGVTAGVAATYMASNLLASQGQANAEYQRALGGSNLEGMRERANAQMFGWANRPLFNGSFGGMGGADAEQLYMGTTQLGLRDRSNAGGFNRGAALGFGQEMYSKLGMRVEDSLEVVRLAAENGESSLSSLADSLDRVSKTARSAGVNTEAARKNFVSYYESAIRAGMGSQSSVSASALATMQAGLGPAFQGINYSPMMNDPRQILMQAQAVGMNMPQYMAATRQQGGAVLQGRASELVQQPVAAQILGQRGMAALAPQMQEMREYSREYRTTNLPRSMWEEGVTQAMGAGVNPVLAQQAVRQMFGLDMTGEEAIQHLIGVQSGLINPSGAAEDEIEASRVQTLSKDERERLSETAGDSELEESMGGINTGSTWSGNTKRRSSNRRYYAETIIGERGTRSPIVEKLLKDQPNERRFRVETKNGPMVVNLEDAMKHYYDQIASGEATIMQGPGEGQTVADWAGMSEDPNAREALGMDSSKDVSKAEAAKHGESLGDFEADKAKDGSKDGRVEIVAAPELANLLRFRPSGSAYMSESARNSGTVPGRTVPATERD